MPMIDFIASSTGPGQSRDSLSNRLVNMYVQTDGPDAKSQKTLYSIPGTSTKVALSTYGATSQDTVRALYLTTTNRLFAVYGGKIFEISDDNTAIKRATFSNISPSVSMADNGKYMLIADGTTMWRYNLTENTNVSITVQAKNPTQVVYYNERFFYINNDQTDATNRRYVYWSGLGDDGPLAWSALNFLGTVGADPIQGISTTGGELWLLGPRSYDVYRESSNVDLPITRVAGSTTEIGIGATNSIASINGRIFWLGASNAGSNQIFVTNGYNTQKISTYPIEWALDQIDNTSDAVGFAYSQLGHIFYCLTFITGNKTFVYDLTTNTWHERSSRNPQTGALDKWHVLRTVSAYNRVYVGCLRSPNVLELDPNVFSEYDGREIQRLYQGKVIWNELKEVFHKALTIDIETGVGLQTGQGSEPRLMMQFSDDGGHTWSSELYTTLGRVGQYKTRAEYRRLGRSRERVYRISVADPVKFVIIGASIDVEVGNR